MLKKTGCGGRSHPKQRVNELVENLIAFPGSFRRFGVSYVRHDCLFGHQRSRLSAGGGSRILSNSRCLGRWETDLGSVYIVTQDRHFAPLATASTISFTASHASSTDRFLRVGKLCTEGGFREWGVWFEASELAGRSMAKVCRASRKLNQLYPRRSKGFIVTLWIRGRVDFVYW